MAKSNNSVACDLQLESADLLLDVTDISENTDEVEDEETESEVE
jgi:hypothetical protein